ncbi:helix-turn-helix domain-containing protein [Micromonospora sp. NPDC049751]|uniref:helix-turn-helix domain-containing protein n=1 Tax=unclassified Micromonospora TaxID=2617518 RepID=UPI0033F3DA49
MTTGDLRPRAAADPAEFVDLLRQLKDRSRLTFRQLEQRAVAAGDVLARSTAADVLRRSTLPRPEVLAAFVRACGAADEVDEWLRARDRLAAGAYASAEPPVEASFGARADDVLTVGPDETRSGLFTRPGPLALLVVATLLVGLGVWFWWPDDDGPRTSDRTAVGASPTGSASANGTASGTGQGSPASGRSRIHPARDPQLCISEGRDRSARYENEVAVQRPCVGATPPETYLVPVTDGMYFVRWEHPVKGIGCLTVRREDPGQNLIEPQHECRTDSWDQLFRFEPTGSAPNAYRLRPAGGDLCVGIRDDDTEVPAEAAAEPCTGQPDQVFLIDPVPEG